MSLTREIGESLLPWWASPSELNRDEMTSLQMAWKRGPTVDLKDNMPSKIAGMAQTAIAASPKTREKAVGLFNQLQNLVTKVSPTATIASMASSPKLDDQKLLAELMARTGISATKMEFMFHGLSEAKRVEIAQHASQFLVQQAVAVNPEKKKVDPSLTDADKQLQKIQIKKCISILGLGSVDEFFFIATVMANMTTEQVTAYKEAGQIDPKLGYV